MTEERSTDNLARMVAETTDMGGVHSIHSGL